MTSTNAPDGEAQAVREKVLTEALRIALGALGKIALTVTSGNRLREYAEDALSAVNKINPAFAVSEKEPQQEAVNRALRHAALIAEANDEPVGREIAQRIRMLVVGGEPAALPSPAAPSSGAPKVRGSGKRMRDIQDALDDVVQTLDSMGFCLDQDQLRGLRNTLENALPQVPVSRRWTGAGELQSSGYAIADTPQQDQRSLPGRSGEFKGPYVQPNCSGDLPTSPSPNGSEP